MKVLTTAGLTKLIELIKNTFLDKTDTIDVSEALATVAITGSYNDLSNTPSEVTESTVSGWGFTKNAGTVTTVNNTSPDANGNVSLSIPTVNNATLTIQKNGTNVATFTANASSNVTANISVPTVTSIYTASGTDAVNGVAVSNAIATKQDNLVSGTNIKTINGTSLLGSGNIVIESSSIPNVDNSTISYNSSDELQTIAVKNKRDNSTLPIWQGTELQWNQGEATPWYYWKNENASWVVGGSTPVGDCWNICFGGNTFVISGESNNAYSTDGGTTWTASSSTGGSLSRPISIAYGNGRFVTVGSSSSARYSNDGNTWYSSNKNTSVSGNRKIAYGNSRFVVVGGGQSTINSANGTGWSSGGTISDSSLNKNILFGNNIFIVTCAQKTFYSTSGSSFSTGGNLPVSSNGGWPLAYGNGVFVAVTTTGNKSAYSTDNGLNWTEGGTLPNSNYYKIVFGDGKFIAVGYNNAYSAFSTDNGVTWKKCTDFSLSGYWNIAYGNNEFVAITDYKSSSVVNSYSLSFSSNSCYTDTISPTTTSTVYSAPETTSGYTITGASSGAITLSDNNTYYYNQSGNQYTYQSVGTAHPDWLCFINGVGVKIGNTTIATNNSNS